MRLVTICLSLIALAGCAQSGSSPSLFSGSLPPPKTVIVSDFAFAPDVVAVDRGFSARLERKIGSYPTFERKQRTNERVNDEIVASIIATLREAGLTAQAGNEDTLTLSDDTVIVSGRLRPTDIRELARPNTIGFGAGRGGVAADMTVSHFSSAGRKQLTAFVVEAPRRGGAAGGKNFGAGVTAALGSEGAAAVKLSPDVEGPARALGRAAGEKIVAFAKEQGWLTAPAATTAPAEEKPGT